ncbi:MAG TPA: 3-isopropylmalate dehydratase small subunit [Candidatus Limnocylindria bacterium]|nr:3-isopropylmalate dehydratase small subunit [Candidatus Limnocylindria bacterium]
MSQPFRRIESAVVPLVRDDIDTDQIIPARFLKAVGRDGMGAALFADWRYEAGGRPRPDFVLNDPAMAGRQVLLAGANFGCGSSREHAPWALLAGGFRAVIATSCADIFRANALKNGLLPVALGVDALGSIAAQPAAKVAVDLETQSVTLPDGSSASFEIDPFSRSMLLAGTDELGYLLSKTDAVADFDVAHPAAITTISA